MGQVGGETYFTRPYDALPSHLKEAFGKEFIGIKPRKPPPVDFSILDIRVGRILRVQKNTAGVKALKKSYNLQVDVGGWERCPRVITAELRQDYTREQLKISKCIVLVNIPPEKTFGQRSWGWLLSARTPEGDIELLMPPPQYDFSDQVTVWGYPPVMDLWEQEDLNVRQLKKLFKDMRINDKGEAEWQGLPMCVAGGYDPIRAGRYARNTPIVSAVKNFKWSKYKYESRAEIKKQLRTFIP